MSWKKSNVNKASLKSDTSGNELSLNNSNKPPTARKTNSKVASSTAPASFFDIIPACNQNVEDPSFKRASVPSSTFIPNHNCNTGNINEDHSVPVDRADLVLLRQQMNMLTNVVRSNSNFIKSHQLNPKPNIANNPQVEQHTYSKGSLNMDETVTRLIMYDQFRDGNDNSSEYDFDIPKIFHGDDISGNQVSDNIVNLVNDFYFEKS
ncbi:hypothetical protein SNE40_008406 [Patella caerulea]|uniref:Uncharacterized protein n=1 Tax=Patella caerulea TaxID=87958 RepID=A0AAN8K017_PATCE